MIVIIHRGHLGFQPLAVTSEVPYSFTKPDLELFISDGILNIPIGGDDLDQDDLGNLEVVMSSYVVSSKVYGRFLQWDKRGPADNIFMKMPHTDKPKSQPTYRRIPLLTSHSTSAVLSRDPTDGDYLTALVHADATFEQIDAFCKEYLTGSCLPFIWTPLKDVHKLIIASQNEDIYYPSHEVRTGPSKYVLELEARVMAREIIEQCAAARETRDARITEQL